MDKARLKEMFADGKRPTGADFAALIDALWANIEQQLVGCMRIVKVKVYDGVPVGLPIGEYGWDFRDMQLYYNTGSATSKEKLRQDVLYDVEDGIYPGGLYVAYGGELRILQGVEIPT